MFFCTGKVAALPFMTQGRFAHSCVLNDNRVIVAGGYAYGALKLVQSLDLRLAPKHLSTTKIKTLLTITATIHILLVPGPGLTCLLSTLLDSGTQWQLSKVG